MLYATLRMEPKTRKTQVQKYVRVLELLECLTMVNSNNSNKKGGKLTHLTHLTTLTDISVLTTLTTLTTKDILLLQLLEPNTLTNISNKPEHLKKNKLQAKSLVQIPSRFAIEMTNRGWTLRNEIIWFKPNCMPSSVKDRFTVDFEKIFFFVKNKKYWFETQRENNQDKFNGQRGSTETRGKMQSSMRDKSSKEKLYEYATCGRNKRCVWKITTKPFKGAHFAVYPPDLIETPIKAGCPKGGVALDPFFGSGTTGIVAKQQGKDFIGIELNPEYIKIAENRINNTQESMF